MTATTSECLGGFVIRKLLKCLQRRRKDKANCKIAKLPLPGDSGSDITRLDMHAYHKSI